MKKNIAAFAWGLTFGIGLIIAQMTNPNKVLAFLDVAGAWDFSLALVMAGALATLAIGLRLKKINQDRDSQRLNLQSFDNSKRGIDTKMIAGSGLFGIGWGLSGFCPGPALVGLTSGLMGDYVFVAAMFAGFGVFHLLHRRS